jgi:predicted DsbA family dithiol-disulfide isomerase
VSGSASAGLTIEIHFDLVCPWCFIGKRQLALALDWFAHELPGVAVASVWVPVQLLPDVPERGLPFAEFYERRLGSPEAVQQRRRQVAQAARSAGLELDLAAIQRMPNTARAHGLLRRVALLRAPELYEALLERLFAAYFQRGEDIGDAATLRSLADEVGVPWERLPEASPGDAALVAPVPGVPYFVFNGELLDGKLFNGPLSLSGAQDPATLLAAMRRTVQAPPAVVAAHG